MSFSGEECRLQICRGLIAQWFNSTFCATNNLFWSDLVEHDHDVVQKEESSVIRDGTRTHNLRCRSPTPYPLGHTDSWNAILSFLFDADSMEFGAATTWFEVGRHIQLNHWLCFACEMIGCDLRWYDWMWCGCGAKRREELSQSVLSRPEHRRIKIIVDSIQSCSEHCLWWDLDSLLWSEHDSNMQPRELPTTVIDCCYSSLMMDRPGFDPKST